MINKASSYSVDARNTIGKLYAAWIDQNKKTSDFLSLISQAGYRITRQSLNNWRRSIVSGRDPVGHYQNCGRKSKLTPELSCVLVGSVLEKNDEGKIVTSRSVARMAEDQMGVKMSDETARVFLRRSGISSRLARRSS